MLEIYDNASVRLLAVIKPKSLVAWLEHNGYDMHHYGRKDGTQILYVTKR